MSSGSNDDSVTSISCPQDVVDLTNDEDVVDISDDESSSEEDEMMQIIDDADTVPRYATPDGTTGTLTHPGLICLRVSKDCEVQLRSPTSMLSDSIVDLALFQVGAMYGDAIPLSEAEILLCEEQVIWRGKTMAGLPLKPPSKRRKPRHFFRKRIVAFPVHTEHPNHWTLGILVNLNWTEAKQFTLGRSEENWCLFHFDSSGQDKSIMDSARQFASFILELPSPQCINAFMIPALEQPAESNDCGLYPFHFLRVFLRDRERNIEYCLRDLSSIRQGSSEARRQWEFNRSLDLRGEVHKLFVGFIESYKERASRARLS